MVLQVNKEIYHDDGVVDLIDELISSGVDYLHLIAQIHIELFHKLVIEADKASILVESSLRAATDPIEVDKNFIERHEPPAGKHWQWDIHT